jgi:hypothetical protein
MAIINSRPLSSANLNDPVSEPPVTPNQLLTMKPEPTSPPPGHFVQEDVYARKRWRRTQYLSEQFWHKWKKEYFLALNRRVKWKKPRRNIQVGDIAIVKDEQLLRCHWKIAKVLECALEMMDWFDE